MALTTVVIPAYNVAPFIGEAIDSVIAQSTPDWQLIIVDDGSQDDTVKIVEKYCATDDRIRLIQQENAGVSAARNTGVAAASTEFISFLDSDDAYTPEYVEEMTRILINKPDAAFSCCDAYYFITEKKCGTKCSDVYPMANPVTLERVALRQFQVYTATTVRYSWFEKVGRFDTEMKSAEDFDLYIRILAQGGQAVFINKPVAWYRRRAGSLSNNISQLTHYTLQVYERLKQTHPEIEIKCRHYQTTIRYMDYVYRSKLALKNRQYDSFTNASKQALALRKNWKLSSIFIISRVSPPVARMIASFFE